MKRAALIIGSVLVLGAVILSGVAFLESLGVPPFYAWQQKRMVRSVLAANPEQLLSAGRELLGRRQGYVGEISCSAPEIPYAIRRLGPTRVSFNTNSVWVDFSDVFNPFGVVVFTAEPQNEGQGLHKWIAGLWLYDDGQLERTGQQIAPPESPLSGSGSNFPIHQALDSLPAPSSSGGR